MTNQDYVFVSRAFDNLFQPIRDRSAALSTAPNALLLAGHAPDSREVLEARLVAHSVFDRERRMYAYTSIVNRTRSLQGIFDAIAKTNPRDFSGLTADIFAQSTRNILRDLQESIYTATRVSDYIADAPFYGFKEDGHGYHFYPSRHELSVPGRRVNTDDVIDNLPTNYGLVMMQVTRLLQQNTSSTSPVVDRYKLMDDISSVLYMAKPLVEKIVNGQIELPSEETLKDRYRKILPLNKAYMGSARKEAQAAQPDR
jgi:hypothetical protein